MTDHELLRMGVVILQDALRQNNLEVVQTVADEMERWFDCHEAMAARAQLRDCFGEHVVNQ